MTKLAKKVDLSTIYPAPIRRLFISYHTPGYRSILPVTWNTTLKMDDIAADGKAESGRNFWTLVAFMLIVHLQAWIMAPR